MEEEVSRKTVAISVQAAKLTGRVLFMACQKFLAGMQKHNRDALTPHGRQTVKQLMGHTGQSNSIQLKGDARLFDRVARKFNVDYAFHKVGPKDYLLFFKAGQADAMTACFSEYSKKVLNKSKSRRIPIRDQIKRAGDQLTREKPKQRERVKEAAHENR